MATGSASALVIPSIPVAPGGTLTPSAAYFVSALMHATVQLDQAGVAVQKALAAIELAEKVDRYEPTAMQRQLLRATKHKLKKIWVYLAP